jgi:hypothetical protein
LANLIDLKPDYGSRPWQIIKELFDFRNALAHGKPEIVKDETDQDLDDYLSSMDFVQAEWEKFAIERNALRAQEDVEKIANLLYKKAGVKHDGPRGPFAHGFQVRSARL